MKLRLCQATRAKGAFRINRPGEHCLKHVDIESGVPSLIYCVLLDKLCFMLVFRASGNLPQFPSTIAFYFEVCNERCSAIAGPWHDCDTYLHTKPCQTAARGRCKQKRGSPSRG
jgi:hypothetical protein